MGRVTKNLLIMGAGLTTIYGVMKAVAKRRTEPADIDDDNPYIYVSDRVHHVEGKAATTYKKTVKSVLDQILSFGGLVVLGPLFGIISLAVYIDDPGPVFFTQKRIGKDKRFFYCHKFRSMRMDTPHDVPTHQLSDPDRYITRVGRFLRRTSMDELPQIWDIFRSKMSVIGPRPALWNQDDLVKERDKYGANNVMPGLTGLAQISGRDELEIVEKARIDGEYVEKQGFLMDTACFIGTIASVLKHDGLVEGGTGEMKKTLRQIEPVNPADVGFDDYGYRKHFNIDQGARKKVLITGAGSYIGESFKAYCESHYPNIECIVIDMADGRWRGYDFGEFDTVFHVAGIAHADVGRTTVEEREKYYEVNTDLAIECCKKAKKDDVKQFIFMSSMIIYGGAEKIDEHTVPTLTNFYGNSKWLADKGVRSLAGDGFYVAVLRAPMIYGKGCRGNYRRLSKMARKVPLFPNVNNKRSMLYIGNLCEFVSLLTLSGAGGIYFPQNGEYTRTSTMINLIGKNTRWSVHITNFLNPAVSIVKHIPIGKIRGLAAKAFGNSYYDQVLSEYSGLDYQKYTLEESIQRTEE